jgi:RHS repeat-associated protein
VTGQKLETYSCSSDTTDSGITSSLEGINVYFGKKLLQSKGAWVVTDKLGTVRANASLGAMNYFPYGEERTSTANGVEKFGTYTRDGVGQDYAEQRYYSSSVGAFWSPDPGGINTANPRNPLSWNRYAYAKGNPISRFDPHGLEDCDPDDPDEGCEDPCDDNPWDPECQQGGGGPPVPRPRKRVIGPPVQVTSLTGVYPRLIMAIQDLGANCQSVLPSQSILLQDASQLTFIDAEPSASGGQTVAQAAANLAPYNPSGTLSSITGGTSAVTLNGPNASISNVVLLGTQFFMDPAYGNNANFSFGQGTVLVHELLHYATQLGDAAFVSNYNIALQPNETASSAIGEWLQNGCKN